MIYLKNIILNTPTDELEGIISPFIEQQFPSFVRTDYRKLVLFIKSYYEWMEKQGNPGYVLSNLDTIYDIDQSLNEFYSHFKSTYLEGFPEELATNTSGNKPNKKTLIKHIRDFYGNKGTESAYQFLFRMLYDSDVEFYYPKTDILKTSDGRWIEPLSVKSTSSNGTDLFGGTNGQLLQYRGSDITGSADIDYVIQYSDKGLDITEYFIKNVSGVFLPNSEVVIQNGENSWKEITYSVLGEYYIETPGSNYVIGDTVLIEDGNGRGALAFIEQTGLGGAIKKIAIKSSGINYATKVYATFISKNGVNQSAVVYLSPTAITRYPGFFSNNSGKLSSTKKIQDGNYYQDFSYELKSSIDSTSYFGVLKELIHPAGMRMFGSILLQGALENTISTSTQANISVSPLVGQYTPYTSGTTLDLRKNGVTASGYWLGATGDLYPLGYNPYIGSTSEVGSNGQTTANGTVFVGTSFGYTLCYVPESGKTSHNPIGSALGSTGAFYSNIEERFTPQGMSDMVLWLKPENIGVCGAVANGASLDIWTDASPQANHALPPTWDKWNSGTTSLYLTSTVGGWSTKAYTTNAVTKVSFRAKGKNPSFHGALFMMGLSRNPGTTTGANYAEMDFGLYPLRSYSTVYSSNRTIWWYQWANFGATASGTTYNGNFGTSWNDNTLFTMEYNKTTGDYKYYVDGTVVKSGTTAAGNTYYAIFCPYNISGTSVTVEDLYNGDTKIIAPGWTAKNGTSPTTGITWANIIGNKIYKCSPTLVIGDGSVSGRTGANFNGGVMWGQNSAWRDSAVTNYAPYSEDFTIANYNTLTGVSVGISYGVQRPPGISLDSGSWGDAAVTLLEETEVTSPHHIVKNMTGVSYVLGATYIASIYGRSGDRDRLAMQFSSTFNATPPSATFNLSNGTVATFAGGTAGIYALGGGWYRCWIAGQPSANVSGGNFFIGIHNSSNNGVFGGTAGKGLYISALQLENGRVLPTVGQEPRPYIKTNSTTPASRGNLYLKDLQNVTFVPGGTAESLLVGSSIHLTRGLTFTDEMDWFMVYRSTAAASSTDRGFIVHSNRPLWDTSYINEDVVMLTRPWNYVDRTTAFPSQGSVPDSSYYYRPLSGGVVTGDTVRRYAETTGALIFRPYGSFISATPTTNLNSIGYDPHYGGLTVSPHIGEVARDSNNRLYAYLNGDEATNYSRSTGLYVAKVTNVAENAGAEVYSGCTVDIGRIGAYKRIDLVSNYGEGTSSFITSAVTNAPYSFQGVLFEVLVFNRKLEETERQKVYGYLSRKYKIDSGLPDAFVNSHPSAYPLGLTYWQIAHHPNSLGLSTIGTGISFDGITLSNFYTLPKTIYKSANTRLPDGTVLGGDTYDTIGA